MNPTEVFRRARDFLIAHRTDYEGACRGFEWPRPERFNWALDWFDCIARGNTSTALRIVGDGGRDAQLTFDELRRRSNFLAAQLRSLGIVRGDRVLLMLGNVPALWELTLACMKLGCPIIPTTTLLMPVDLQDRVERGGARVVIADPTLADRFEAAAGTALRVLIRDTRPGWHTSPNQAPGMISIPARRRSRPIPCFCISLPAPLRNPSSSCKRTRAIPSGICQQCIGSACGRATGI